MDDTDIHVGRDGWLFLAGGSNRPFDYLTGIETVPPETGSGWYTVLTDRRDRLAPIPYIHLIVPNKETIYSEQAGISPDERDRGPLGSILGQLTADQRTDIEGVLLDPRHYMRSLAAEHQLYWKVDSHWSPVGCFAAYQLLCSRLSADPLRDLLSRPFTQGTLAMDLGGRLRPPLEEAVRFYDFCTHAKRVGANELVEMKEDDPGLVEDGLHVGSQVAFHNDEAPDQRRLLLFGDSFAEYRTSLLTGMLAETFRDVYFVWSSSVDHAIVERVCPDVVCTELAERFHLIVPSDGLDLDAYAASRVQDVLDCARADVPPEPVGPIDE